VFQPTGTGLVECNWTVSYRLTIPTDWVSGVYLVKLSLSAPAKESYIVFVVRDDARNAPILVQASFATYQAYNEWGGSSLYSRIAGTKTGYKVSFNRPFWRNFGAGDFVSLNGSPGFEIHLVRWLESQGYDATYATDLDTHENPTLLLLHKLLLVAAHDEYWSWSMRDTVERGRDAGVHLGFLGANACYWQVRFEPSSAGDLDRTMVGYKELAAMDHPADPRYVTTLWRNIRPEAALVGVQYNDVSDTTPSDIVVTNASHWLFNGTGLINGSILPNVLGYETDSMTSSSPAGTISMAHSPFPKGAPQVSADMSMYTAPSGANVLATGTTEWSLGLDGYPPSHGIVPGVQQVTANFLSRALQSPTPTIGRLAATVATSAAAPGYPTSYAGDRNTSTQWVASLNSNDPNNNNAWIYLDFGARMQLQSLKWLGAGGTPYPASSPTNYSIQTSDDGITWQTIITRSNSSPVANGSEPLNVQTRFLRMLTTKVGDGSGWSLSFFEFWAEGSVTPTLSSLALNPTSVTGADPSIGMVTLSGPAPSGGAVVSLSSSNPAVASVPGSGSVTVPAGATSATFTVTTSAVATSTTVAISASYGSGTPQAASLTVMPPILSSLALSLTSVTGGTPSTGTVTLSGPAPGGGAFVSLSSNNPAVASVPGSGSVTIPAGATSATFTVTTSAVATSTTVTISSSYSDGTPQTALLTVIPPALSSLSLSPATVTGGNPSTGTVTLNGPAPSGGSVVSLSSSNPSVASVPPSGSAIVPAGSTTATFTVNTRIVLFSTSATISASYNSTTQSAILKVNSLVPGIF
jgi:hypothetical protein